MRKRTQCSIIPAFLPCQLEKAPPENPSRALTLVLLLLLTACRTEQVVTGRLEYFSLQLFSVRLTSGIGAALGFTRCKTSFTAYYSSALYREGGLVAQHGKLAAEALGLVFVDLGEQILQTLVFHGKWVKSETLTLPR